MKHTNILRTISLLLILLLVAVTALACAPVKTDDQTGLRVALDLTEEWDEVSPAGSLVQGCVVVRREFAEQNPAAVAAFLDEYKASINTLLADVKAGAAMVAAQGIFAKALVAEQAIPNCNICFMEGDDMKSAMSEFLNIMMSAAPASIGNAIPADDFYYARTAEAAGSQDLTIRVSVLSGTTGFGMAPLMQQNADGTSANKYDFKVEAEASNITAALVKGNIDIAALPTNAAATLYNNTDGKVQLLAINTLGVLYLLDSTGEVQDFADLKGKTVYVPAQNPTFIFQYLCEQNGLTAGTDGDVDVIISNKYAAPAELQKNVAAGTVTIAVLPEPMVTIALTAAAQAAAGAQ